MSSLRINSHTAIPWEDLTITFDRSSGPGGQNVNKVNTRVTLRLNVHAVRGLTEEQRRRLSDMLASRLDANGDLRIVCGTHRTQGANREEAIARLVELLRGALRPPRVRRPTKSTAASRERRLQTK